jgi:hypothetical protein
MLAGSVFNGTAQVVGAMRALMARHTCSGSSLPDQSSSPKSRGLTSLSVGSALLEITSAASMPRKRTGRRSVEMCCCMPRKKGELRDSLTSCGCATGNRTTPCSSATVTTAEIQQGIGGSQGMYIACAVVTPKQWSLCPPKPRRSDAAVAAGLLTASEPST